MVQLFEGVNGNRHFKKNFDKASKLKAAPHIGPLENTYLAHIFCDL
jgi:hypothetical protein